MIVEALIIAGAIVLSKFIEPLVTRAIVYSAVKDFMRRLEEHDREKLEVLDEQIERLEGIFSGVSPKTSIMPHPPFFQPNPASGEHKGESFPYRCPECEAHFKEIEQLERHLGLHGDEKASGRG